MRSLIQSFQVTSIAKSLRPSPPKFYFPNLVISMVGKTDPPHGGRLPNEFVFRIPKYMTRFDLQQYLHHLYNVNPREILHIRTFIFPGTRKIGKRWSGKTGALSSASAGGKRPDKKNAIVTLKERINSTTGELVPMWSVPDFDALYKAHYKDLTIEDKQEQEEQDKAMERTPERILAKAQFWSRRSIPKGLIKGDKSNSKNRHNVDEGEEE